MKAAIIFTGTGPILILTSYESFTDPKFVDTLNAKGITRFIACEIPLDRVKEKYVSTFDTVMNDVKQVDDLRVLDYNGHNVFHNFSFSEMGKEIKYEPQTA